MNQYHSQGSFPGFIEHIPSRFNSLDVIRGFAALSVVFWHWQHFFYQGTFSQSFAATDQPLYSLFYIFYKKGYLAVDFFFVLSGFIFFWLYSEKITRKEISGYNFFILRFSRLYPLHFITLMIVMIGQIISKNLTGSYTVYPYNDPYHFILHLFFVSNWGFHYEFSFNAPVWSVSVEILLYIIFFYFSIFCRKLKIGKLKIILFVIITSILLKQYNDSLIQRGVLAFFIGGATYYSYVKLKSFNLRISWIITGILSAILWIMAIVDIKIEFHSLILKNIKQIFVLHEILSFMIIYYIYILFSMTILHFSFAETYLGTLGSRLKFLGDISYSSYMLHFPLQLAFILISKGFNIDNHFYYTGISLLMFFSILLIISYFSFYYFERPLQNKIRERFYK